MCLPYWGPGCCRGNGPPARRRSPRDRSALKCSSARSNAWRTRDRPLSRASNELSKKRSTVYWRRPRGRLRPRNRVVPTRTALAPDERARRGAADDARLRQTRPCDRDDVRRRPTKEHVLFETASESRLWIINRQLSCHRRPWCACLPSRLGLHPSVRSRSARWRLGRRLSEHWRLDAWS